ncbi:hypothetical protein I308_101535 [Cryptococcus tetragattii IND107]|uniref:Uncharacterized protein n=1 Tax=Cryptococcus tetragattii IND107 TaxID=1296105 RepID=A0ABR3C0J9_9TREE
MPSLPPLPVFRPYLSMSEAPPIRSCSQCRSIPPHDCLTRLCDHCKNLNRERQARYFRKKRGKEAQSTPKVTFPSWLLLKHAFTEAFENHASQKATETEPIRPLHFKSECVLDDGLRPVDNTPAALDTRLRRLGLFLASVDTGLAYRFR